MKFFFFVIVSSLAINAVDVSAAIPKNACPELSLAAAMHQLLIRAQLATRKDLTIFRRVVVREGDLFFVMPNRSFSYHRNSPNGQLLHRAWREGAGEMDLVLLFARDTSSLFDAVEANPPLVTQRTLKYPLK